MSSRRHDTREGEGDIRSYAIRHSSGDVLSGHRHTWPQLIYASEGMLRVDAAGEHFAVPPQRALWVPAEVEHSLVMSGPVFLQTLYLRPGLVQRMKRVAVVFVPPLFRELILETIRLETLDSRIALQGHLIAVLIAQLQEAAPPVPRLPSPKDPRALRVAERLYRHPESTETLAALGRAAGASPRTLERVFRAEVGLSFRAWRQQLRLQGALALLSGGRLGVTEVALEMGYASASAFIAAFKRAFGDSPGKMMRQRRT